jgi:hypothetical protein
MTDLAEIVESFKLNIDRLATEQLEVVFEMVRSELCTRNDVKVRK